MNVKLKLLLIGLGLVGYLVFFVLTRPSTSAPTSPLVFDYYPAKKFTNKVIIMLHGGSWTVGNKDQLSFVGTYLADRGLNVINMNYRLAPEWTYDAPLKDIAVMINQIDTAKESYGVTEGYQLYLLGFSAGGHLVNQFCLLEDAYAVKQITGCIGLAGIYDLQRIVEGKDGSLLIEAVENFLGDTPAKDASPYYQVQKGETTNFLLFAGEEDSVVASSQMTEFVKMLKANSVMVEGLTVPQKNHLQIFETIPLDDQIGKKIIEFVGLTQESKI